MCFSASASFLVSGGVAAVGVASVHNAKPGSRLFAIIPFFFAIQQLLEGLQWLAVKPSPWSLLLGYAFLFFAFLLWPVYLPIAVHQLERNKRRKRILRWFIAAGGLVTLTLLAILLTQPLAVRVLPQGIDYHIRIPFLWAGPLLYAAVTCGSCFVSTQQYLRWFGIALAGSAAVTWIVFGHTFVSVWCFAAAVLSTMIYFFYRKRRTLLP
ncbi:hypothetical protein HY479_02080 [Candidatus Uhrbacteria bacterium]|nr:hypothetical protein [Candidatus Uhrbacteria bacterium]